MKKLLIITTLLITLSCSKDINPPPRTLNGAKITEINGYQKISYPEARSIAETAYSYFENEQTKGQKKTIAGNAIISGNLTPTKSNDTSIDTLLYVFNYANNEGYVIIPTNNVNGQLVAYVEQGCFNIQDTIENDLSKMLVHLMINKQLIANTVYEASLIQTKNPFGVMETTPIGPMCKYTEPIDNPIFPAPAPAGPEGNTDVDYAAKYGCYRPVNQIAEPTTVYNKRPLLTTCWEQGSPFNDLAPLVFNDEKPPKSKRADAGCVPVAVAQIMAYHAWPTTYPTFSQSEISSFSGNLTYLTNLRTYKDLGSFIGVSIIIKKQISRLLRITGVLLNCSYTYNGTPAFSEYVPECLYKLGYTMTSIVNYDITPITNSLNHDKPVYISGSRISNTGNKIGHAWVLDGYKTLKWRVDRYGILFDENGKFTKTKYISTGFADEEFVHCNFGWNGMGNGYYSDGIFETSHPQELTGFSKIPERVYEYDLRIIPNVTKR